MAANVPSLILAFTLASGTDPRSLPEELKNVYLHFWYQEVRDVPGNEAANESLKSKVLKKRKQKKGRNQ